MGKLPSAAGFFRPGASLVPGPRDSVVAQALEVGFRHLRKDSRYYEIVEDTICPEFDYRYFAINDASGLLSAVQPFFLLDQDLLAGAGPRAKAFVNAARRVWPRFLKMRTLMVGCAAGEGHLDAQASNRRAARWPRRSPAGIVRSRAAGKSLAHRYEGVPGGIPRRALLLPRQGLRAARRACR